MTVLLIQKFNHAEDLIKVLGTHQRNFIGKPNIKTKFKGLLRFP